MRPFFEQDNAILYRGDCLEVLEHPAHETLIWAARDRTSKHVFTYHEMKSRAGSRQMKAFWSMVGEDEIPGYVWTITPPSASGKRYGKHPTQKPEALRERCIVAISHLGQTVLDPFCGHAGSVVACANLRRRFIGIGNDERYLEVAARRIEDALHGTTPRTTTESSIPLTTQR